MLPFRQTAKVSAEVLRLRGQSEVNGSHQEPEQWSDPFQYLEIKTIDPI